MEYMQEGRKTKESKKRDLITCHAGRRTYISIMVESGLGLYELMSTTGHKKIDTLKFYIDRFGKSRREKFEKINNILNNTTVNENR
jgi:integrase